MIRLALVFILLATGCRSAHESADLTPRTGHVFIISIDGGKPEAIAASEMPVLKNLAAEGASTWTAQSIIPPVTLPAHASMLTGVPMEQHGLTWNDWKPANGLVRVPTIFSAAHAAGRSTAIFAGKEKFRHLLLPGTVDEFYYDRSNAVVVLKSDRGDQVFKKEGCIAARTVAANAADYILKAKPALCFIHFPDPDTVGHQFGWGTPEQIKAFAETDAGLGTVIESIRSAGIAGRSVVIVTADHGGHGKGHGLNIPEDMNIPWIIWGEGVKKNYVITTQVTTCDTAATALWLLGVKPMRPMAGVPVASAFQ